MSEVFGPFLSATIRTATPLALAAIGEVVVERAGMINLGLEGAILAGAFGSLAGATTGGIAAGYAGAICGGVITAVLFALFVVWLRADQIITGTAITLLSAGATGTLYRIWYGAAGAALGTPTSTPIAIPILSRLPVLGSAIFTQPLVTYVVYALVPLVAWWLGATHSGLALRSVGERPSAAIAAGVHVTRVRTMAILFGGALGGLAGGTLVLAQAGTFAEGMSAGRGFIAVSIVVLGRWNPGGVALAALVFGAASALQFAFQAMGWHAPYQLFLVVPYALTLAALAGLVGRARPPASLGKPLD